MEYFDKTTFPEAQLYLKSTSSNNQIVDEIRNFICRWNFRSEHDLTMITIDLDNLNNLVHQQFFKDKEDFRIFESIHCIVHNLLWDNLKPLIRATCCEDDTNVYEKFNILCKYKKLPIELTKTAYYFVSYPAAIVELSMWDSYNSPLEKLNCLCTTYDIIFAELKAALVNLISKYSEKEIEIPIINNKDVLPIISLVLMKSKLRYPCSNLYYIKNFGKHFIQDSNKRYILKTFEQSIETFLKTDLNYLLSNCNGQCPNIDFCEAIEKLNDINLKKNNPLSTSGLQEENKNRVLSLILESTTSNDLLSVNLP